MGSVILPSCHCPAILTRLAESRREALPLIRSFPLQLRLSTRSATESVDVVAGWNPELASATCRNAESHREYSRSRESGQTRTRRNHEDSQVALECGIRET